MLAQQRQASTTQGTNTAAPGVASVKPGTGATLAAAPQQQQQPQAQGSTGRPHEHGPIGQQAQAQTQLQQPLSDHDFAKVKLAVRARDEPKLADISPVTGAGAGTGVQTPPGSAAAAASPQVSNTASPGVVSSARAAAASKGSDHGSDSDGAGIDQRLFAPVLRAILAGEGDHVLRRSLLCHPFLKGVKTGGSSASAASPGSKDLGTTDARKSAPSPLGSSGSGSGRRKGSKGSKGGKAKKRDRDRDKESGDWGPAATRAAQVGPASASKAEKKPLNAAQEVSRLAELAASDGSLQSTLVLVKTLLCAVDPATSGVDESARRSASSGRLGRTSSQGSTTSGGATTGSGGGGKTPSAASMGLSPELTVRTPPLRALAGRGLSEWSDVLELLRREKYRERMVSLRGRPSLTVCCGKAENRGRLEVKGEASGIVTGVQVRNVDLEGTQAMREGRAVCMKRASCVERSTRVVR